MDKAIHEQPLVSIVMCAYNGLPYIQEAVFCILNQTYDNWEFIISDDGSSDGTREWLKTNLATNPKIRLFFQENNLGYVANKNFVHQQAKGLFITQLDNDDLCTLDRLEKQVAVINKHPEVKIVGCGFARIDALGKVKAKVSSQEPLLIKSDYHQEYPFWFPSLFVHRSLFERIGYFNNYFSGTLADDLYWTKKVNQIVPIYCLPDVLYHYRDNPGSITNHYNNVRKLIMPEVVTELIRQMRIGDDWLSSNNFAALQAYETSLLSDRAFMSEKYRVWAARAIDQNKSNEALHLIWKSMNHKVTNARLYRTILYFIRKLISTNK